MHNALSCYISSLEKYLLADDRTAFINSLKVDSKERMVLELLTSKLTKDTTLAVVQKKFEEIGIQESFLEEFVGFKTLNLIKKTKNKEDG